MEVSMKTWLAFVGAICALTLAACGGGGGGGTDTGGGTDQAGPQDPGPADPGGTPDRLPVDPGPTPDPGSTPDQGPTDPGVTPDQGGPEMVTFKAIVKDNLTKELLKGAKVTAYDNETGEATQYSATSGSDGTITMELPKGTGKMGFKVSLQGYKDTFQFNIAIDTGEQETLWSVSENGYKMAAALAGFTPDPTKAIVAGAIYWVNDQGEEEYVGCATITSDPAGEYRYFGDTGLPAPLAQVPETTTGKGEARFVAGNVPPGKCTLKAWVKGQEVGSASLFTFADSICINNIYTQGTSNPTPADCTK